MISFMFGLWIGGAVGVVTMCLLQAGKDYEATDLSSKEFKQ
ncbi:MAG: DUF3789 domain-containing protein [Clostridia bacterium]|nr:DUF3789 domain-containing protein [Clostridia bacterium]